jgi:hypothetical protein
MFVELMPLLAGRTVLITVAKLDDRTLRVNVIPALAKADDNPALNTPLTALGFPRDAKLARFVACGAPSTANPPDNCVQQRSGICYR